MLGEGAFIKEKERKEQMYLGYLMPESKEVLKDDGDISENIQTTLKGHLLGELR